MWPARSPEKRSGPKPDINVTPLVDVCLVLLIIFMVVMPQLQNGGQVEVPGVHNPDPKREESPLTITMTADRRFLVEDRSMDEAALFAFLQSARAADANRRLRLKGDRTLPYGAVRDVFARCQALGFRGVALLVTSRKTPVASLVTTIEAPGRMAPCSSVTLPLIWAVPCCAAADAAKSIAVTRIADAT